MLMNISRSETHSATAPIATGETTAGVGGGEASSQLAPLPRAFSNAQPSADLFGDIPVVRERFELVILGIIGISVLPIAIELFKGWRAERSEGT